MTLKVDAVADLRAESEAAKRRVLIAEDESTTRLLMRVALEQAGFDVQEAADGLEALGAYERTHPDLVILDVEMPGLDGIGVCRRLRQRRDSRHVPIVIATTLDDTGSIDAAYAAGATDFIAKPINWALLRHRVRYILRSSGIARELGRSEEKFRHITESSSDFIAMLDRDGRRLYSSPSYKSFFGTDELAGSDSFREIHPDDRDTIRDVFRATVATGVGRDARFRWVLPDGGVRHLESKGNVILDDAGEVSRVVVVSRDVTDRALQHQKIERLSRITAMLGAINSAIVRIRDRQALLDEACRIAVDHGGFSFAWVGLVEPATLAVQPAARAGDGRGFLEVARFSVREDVPEGQTMVGRVVRGRRPVVSNDIASDASLRHGKEALARGFRALVGLPLVVGSECAGVLALYSATPGFFDEEEMRLLEELAGDIAFGLAHIEKEREAHYLAYYDPLTELPNRRLFQETLATLTEAKHLITGKLVVMVVDVRGFHVVNDNLGRHEGDSLLKLVARRLRDAVSPSDTIGRIGGDQFGIILTDIAGDAQIAATVGRIFASLEAPFETGGQPIHLVIKGGASVFPTATDGLGADALLTNAEAALKKAKASLDPWLFYAPHLNAALANRVALENALLRALDEGQFRLLYQPKVDLRTGRAHSLEALLYWDHPAKGIVSPASFIPVLEETGMILGVGSWVMRQAMEDLHRLRNRGFASLRIAVNVSPLQFRQHDFPGYLAAAVGAGSQGLDIEITESVMMQDIEACIAVLWRVREMGFGVALDDFGTGYSSLSYVSRLPATTLKIDKSFIDDLPENPGRIAIVQAVISLAHALGMRVVAEGVETEEQANLLKELSCDEMQGYLYSRPMPIEAVEGLL